MPRTGLPAQIVDLAVYADGTVVWGRGFGGRHIQSADGLLMRNVTTWFGGAIGIEKSGAT